VAIKFCVKAGKSAVDYESVHSLIHLKMEVVHSFETSTQPCGATNQKTHFLHMKTSLQLIKLCSAVSFSVDKATTLLL